MIAADNPGDDEETIDEAFVGDDQTEDDYIQSLASEGHDEAALILDFEAAAEEVIQSDGELALAYNSYVEARRKLGEKFRNRFLACVQQRGHKRKGKIFSRSTSRPMECWKRFIESEIIAGENHDIQAQNMWAM